MINTIILGVAATIIILFFFSELLDKENPWHSFFRNFVILFAITLLLFMPKAALDDQTVCETVVNNATYVNATFTTYEYTDFCYVRDETTASNFFTAIVWFFRIFWFGVIIYGLIYVFELMKEAMKRKGRM